MGDTFIVGFKRLCGLMVKATKIRNSFRSLEIEILVFCSTALLVVNLLENIPFQGRIYIWIVSIGVVCFHCVVLVWVSVKYFSTNLTSMCYGDNVLKI